MTVDFSVLTDLINATMSVLAAINTNFSTVIELVINIAVIAIVGVVILFVKGILGSVLTKMHMK